MYVKALTKGYFDLARNGAFVEIKPGQIFQVPDNTTARWFVACDEKGNVTDQGEVAKGLSRLEAQAKVAEGEAKLAADKAKQARERLEAERARAADLAEKRNPKKKDGDK